jgi:hypothetical protein
MKLIALTLMIASCQFYTATPLNKKDISNKLKTSPNYSVNSEAFITGPKKRKNKVYLC